MIDILKNIEKSFNNQFSFQERRPGVYQLYLPIYHEDGDMIDLFIKPINKKEYLLFDYAHTLQRLSYSYDIDTPNKENILNKILAENHLTEHEGNISFKAKQDTIFSDIMHVAQTYAKIGSMKYFNREVIENLFFEELASFVTSTLTEFKPKINFLPIKNREDLKADFSFTPNGHDVYLFGIKDSSDAKVATISCLEFQRAKLKFRSVAVYNNLSDITKADQLRLMSACDKQFPSLDEFKNGAFDFMSRERNLM